MIQSFQIGVKGLLCVDESILLLRDPRIWDLPGGRIDGNESPLDALSRELKEELPEICDISIGPLVGWHRPADVVPKNDHSLMLMIFLMEANIPEPISISAEHTSAQWAPIEIANGLCPQLTNIDWGLVQRAKAI